MLAAKNIKCEVPLQLNKSILNIEARGIFKNLLKRSKKQESSNAENKKASL